MGLPVSMVRVHRSASDMWFFFIDCLRISSLSGIVSGAFCLTGVSDFLPCFQNQINDMWQRRVIAVL
jgi:hypothetical protein